MKNFFGAKSKDDVANEYNTLVFDLFARQMVDPKHIQMRSVSLIYRDKSFDLLPSYVKRAKETFEAEPRVLDFRGSPDKSRTEINTFVEKKTNGLIPDLIPRTSVSSSTKAVLVNAIYFKGINGVIKNWQRTQFQPLILICKGLPIHPNMYRF